MIRRAYQWVSDWLARPFVPGAPALWAFPIALTAGFVWLARVGAPGPWSALTAVGVAALVLLVAAGVRQVARRWRAASAAVFGAWMLVSAVVAIGAVVVIGRTAYTYFTGDVWVIEGWEAYDQLAQFAGVVTLALAAVLAEISARQAYRVADMVWDGRAFAPARVYPPVADSSDESESATSAPAPADAD